MCCLRKTVSIDMKDIKLSDRFWSAYEKTIREVTIPYQWEILNDSVPDSDKSHAIRNFRIAAGLEKGEFYGFVFQDSDAYKWLEGVAYSLLNKPDKKLEAEADGLIDLIGMAQQPDGYLNTYFTITAPEKRWTNLHDCHELYCAGHLIEAAAAYYGATGKRKLLDIACRFADYIDSVFGPEPEKLKGYPGHEEIELALIKLYHATQNIRYIKLSLYFLNQRGTLPYYFDEEWEKRGRTGFWNIPSGADRPSLSKRYNQTHLPVREQEEATGHAVRAMYLYTAMAAAALETNDAVLFGVCRKLWNSVTLKQMYITGGIGSTHIGEAFTFGYDLPNETAYTETCASIGLVFFAAQMLQTEPDAVYADVIEKILYNVIPSSLASDGKRFFYVNPLEVWPEACVKNPDRSHVKPTRQTWFGCACCPPNLVRLIESLRSYLYRLGTDCLYIDQYIGSSARFQLGGAEGLIRQEANYPANGDINFNISLSRPADFSVALRFPSWCGKANIRVNGVDLDINPLMRGGYTFIRRTWNSGDRIELILDMPVYLTEANPKVRADAGKVAIQRGPVVYCLEEADNGPNLSAVSINADTAFAMKDGGFPGGIPVLEGDGVRTSESGWEGKIYRPLRLEENSIRFRAVPYFAWGDRGEGEMSVWMRVKQ